MQTLALMLATSGLVLRRWGWLSYTYRQGCGTIKRRRDVAKTLLNYGIVCDADDPWEKKCQEKKTHIKEEASKVLKTYQVHNHPLKNNNNTNNDSVGNLYQ